MKKAKEKSPSEDFGLRESRCNVGGAERAYLLDKRGKPSSFNHLGEARGAEKGI